MSGSSNGKHTSSSNSNTTSTSGSITTSGSQHSQHQHVPPPPPPPSSLPQQPQQIMTCISSDHNHNGDGEEQNIAVSAQSASSLTQNSLANTNNVSLPGNSILSSAQMATIPVILSETNKHDLTQQQTAFIVTPVSQLVQPFQAGHAITVTPITNTAYAFATM